MFKKLGWLLIGFGVGLNPTFLHANSDDDGSPYQSTTTTYLSSNKLQMQQMEQMLHCHKSS